MSLNIAKKLDFLMRLTGTQKVPPFEYLLFPPFVIRPSKPFCKPG